MTELGLTRDQVVEHHQHNLREYKQGQTSALGREYREEVYGRWRNQDEARRRREQGMRRGWEWTEKQWHEWKASWKEHHWS